MKKWIVIAIVAAIVAVVLFTDFGWQTISMVVAGVSGIGKLIFGRFGSASDKIKQAHAKTRAREQEYQDNLAGDVQRHQKQVSALEMRLADLNTQLDDLDARRAGINDKVENMSRSELKAAGQNYFGS